MSDVLVFLQYVVYGIGALLLIGCIVVAGLASVYEVEQRMNRRHQARRRGGHIEDLW